MVVSNLDLYKANMGNSPCKFYYIDVNLESSIVDAYNIFISNIILFVALSINKFLVHCNVNIHVHLWCKSILGTKIYGTLNVVNIIFINQ
jgi:hypothetical protein